MDELSFIENPFKSELKNRQSLMAGIVKVIAIYLCDDSKKIITLCADNSLNSDSNIEEDNFETNAADIERLRNTITYFNWYKKSDLPFGDDEEPEFDNTVRKSKGQLNVFDEYDNVVLGMGFRNEHDQKHDVLLFYFNQNLNNFGVSDSKQFLSTESKQVLGYSMYTNIRRNIEKAKNDRKIFDEYNRDTRFYQDRYEESLRQFDKLKDKHQFSLIELCNSYLKECSHDSPFSYSLSDDAKEKIRAYDGEISTLKTAIEKAVRYQKRLYNNSDIKKIVITGTLLVLENRAEVIRTAVPAMKEKSREPKIDKNKSKIFSFLNNAYNALREVKAQGLPLTSANVAAAMSPPRSAAAISFTLSKHRDLVIEIMKEYPANWDLLHSDFKPIINIIYPKKDNEETA